MQYRFAADDGDCAVELVKVRPGAALPGNADLVILPGSKATIADLATLRKAGHGNSKDNHIVIEHR